MDEPQTSGLAISSLVFGILAVFLGWIPLVGWLIIMGAIICGILGLSQTQDGTMRGRNFAIAGLVLGIVSIIFIIIGIFLLATYAPFLMYGGIPLPTNDTSQAALSGDAFWNMNGEIGVEDVQIWAGTFEDSLVLRNLQTRSIRIDSVLIGPIDTLVDLHINPTTLAVGQTAMIKHQSAADSIPISFFSCIPGRTFSVHVAINYTVVATKEQREFTGSGNVIQGVCKGSIDE